MFGFLGRHSCPCEYFGAVLYAFFSGFLETEHLQLCVNEGLG